MVKKNQLAIAIAGVLGVSMSAHAVVDIDNPTASKWAAELLVDDAAAPVLVDGVGNLLDLSTTIGFGVAETEVRYLRLDLTNARFNAVPVCEHTSSVNDASGACNQELGGINNSYVVYTLTAGDINEVLPSDVINFSFAANQGIKRTAEGNITVRYTMHNGELSADNNSATGRLVDKSAPYIEFLDVVDLTGTPVPNAVSDVATEFKQFRNGKLTAAIGQITYRNNPETVNTVNSVTAPTDATTAVLGNVIGSATLTVSGDFTATQDVVGGVGQGTYTAAINKVFFAANSDCTGTLLTANSVNPTTAVFNVGTTTLDPGYLCFQANNATPMVPSDYSVEFTATANTGYSVENQNLGVLGRIVQNGTVLDSPYFTLTSGYISRFYLVNNGTTDVTYTTTIISDSGNAVTAGAAASGTLPAGTNLQINAADLAGMASKPRGAVRFTLVGDNRNIQGVYQTVNLNSLDVQSVPLIRRGGGDGSSD